MSDLNTQIIPVTLANGKIIRVEAVLTGEGSTSELNTEEIESDVSIKLQPLKEVTDAIEGIATTLKESIDKVKPSKASVEFGLEFGCESGELTALIVRGSSKANLKVVLEWQDTTKP